MGAMEVEPVFRALGAADTALLGEMHRLAFDATWDRVWTATSFADILAMPGACGMLATLADEPVAFGAMLVAANEAELLLLATLPRHRRAGIARRLLKELTNEARARGASRILLEVAAPNEAALAFYEAAGFSACGRRRDYYPGGTDALVLEKNCDL